MANEPSWDDIFTPQPRTGEQAAQPAQSAPAAAPSSAREDDSFSQLFGGGDNPATAMLPAAGAPGGAPAQPPAQSRRELRENEGKARSGSGGGGRNSGGSSGAGGSGSGRAGKPQSMRCKTRRIE